MDAIDREDELENLKVENAQLRVSLRDLQSRVLSGNSLDYWQARVTEEKRRADNNLAEASARLSRITALTNQVRELKQTIINLRATMAYLVHTAKFFWVPQENEPQFMTNLGQALAEAREQLKKDGPIL